MTAHVHPTLMLGMVFFNQSESESDSPSLLLLLLLLVLFLLLLFLLLISFLVFLITFSLCSFLDRRLELSFFFSVAETIVAFFTRSRTHIVWNHGLQFCCF